MKLFWLIFSIILSIVVFTRAEDDSHDDDESDESVDNGFLSASVSAMQLQNNNIGDINNIKRNLFMTKKFCVETFHSYYSWKLR